MTSHDEANVGCTKPAPTSVDHYATDAESSLVEIERSVPVRGGALNIARFDLVSLRLVVYCAQLGSLSAASRKTSCSISACSHRLTSLENALGLQLFTRDPRGLELTEAGKIFLAHAIEILRRIEQMYLQLTSPSMRFEIPRMPRNPSVNSDGSRLP